MTYDAELSARWNECVLGEVYDEEGDPPRVYHPRSAGGGGGCAFTRSIGDFSSEKFGVTAEAELLTHALSPNDQFLVIASDGVWEFLTNKEVVDLVSAASDPLDACRDIVSQAYAASPSRSP